MIPQPARTKAAYAEFLKSEFWRNLRQRKLLINPLCQFTDCGLCARDVHHVFYRPVWTDTQIGDLLSVCGIHHRKIHGIQEPPKPRRHRVIKPNRVTKAQYKAIKKRGQAKRLEFRQQRNKTKAEYLQELYSRKYPARFKRSKTEYKAHKKERRRLKGMAAYQHMMNRGRL